MTCFLEHGSFNGSLGVEVDTNIIRIFIAVEANNTVYDGDHRYRINGKWMSFEDSPVAIFTYFQRTNTTFDSELLRWIDGDQRQRLVITQSTVLLCLCRFVVQVADQFTGVGVDGCNNAIANEDRCIICR